MDVEVLTSTDQLAGLEGDWLRLEDADSRATFFSGYHCVSSWWGSFGTDESYELRVHVARHNGEVVGILPLALHRQTPHGQPYAQLRFASHGDSMGAVVDPRQTADSVCGALLDAVTGSEEWDELVLNYVPMPSTLALFLLRSELRPRFTHLIEQPYLDLRDGQREVRVPGKARKYRNKLFREQDVTFRVLEDDEDDILERLGRLHQHEKLRLQEAGRKERHSWYDDALRYGHYRRLYAKEGTTVTFAYERGDGQLVAARSAFRHRRALLSWTSAYDPDLAAYRLGKCLQLDILDHLRTMGSIEEFDFGTGGYPWKFEWTDRCRHDYRLRIVRRERPRRRAAPAGEKAQTATSKPAIPAPPPSKDTPTRQVVRVARRVQRQVVGRALRREVWYLGSPADLVVWFAPSRLRSVDPSRLHVVLLGHGDLEELVGQVSAELPQPVAPEDLAAASTDEAVRAAVRLGVPPGQVLPRELGPGEPDLRAVATLVRGLAHAHPSALHVFPPAHAHGGGLGAGVNAVAGRASRHGLAVVRLTGPADLTGPSAAVSAAVDELRDWDPDRGRYAVHRTAVSRALRGPAGP